MTTINEARAVSKKIAYHARKRFLDECREAYNIHRAEARACGYEVEDFETFIGEADPKAKAAARMASIPSDEIDLY